MYGAARKSKKENKSSAAAEAVAQQIKSAKIGNGFVNNRPKAIDRSRLRAMGNSKVKQAMQEKGKEKQLPDDLKEGIENFSGYSIDDVNVHYNSPRPAHLQAQAYTQGQDIHMAPGQDKHLPQEAWHVVPQKQGGVKPTMQMNGVNINDDEGLEEETTSMGNHAAQSEGYMTRLVNFLPVPLSPKSDASITKIRKSNKEGPIIQAYGKDKDPNDEELRNKSLTENKDYIKKKGEGKIRDYFANKQEIKRKAGRIYYEFKGEVVDGETVGRQVNHLQYEIKNTTKDAKIWAVFKNDYRYIDEMKNDEDNVLTQETNFRMTEVLQEMMRHATAEAEGAVNQQGDKVTIDAICNDSTLRVLGRLIKKRELTCEEGEDITVEHISTIERHILEAGELFKMSKRLPRECYILDQIKLKTIPTAISQLDYNNWYDNAQNHKLNGISVSLHFKRP